MADALILGICKDGDINKHALSSEWGGEDRSMLIYRLEFEKAINGK